MQLVYVCELKVSTPSGLGAFRFISLNELQMSVHNIMIVVLWNTEFIDLILAFRPLQSLCCTDAQNNSLLQNTEGLIL